MENYLYVPDSLRAAGRQIKAALAAPLAEMGRADFLRAWCSVAYLFPGLHPDGFEDNESGWPRVLRRFAAEAWRRAETGEIEDDELYPSDAQWAGLYDRMAAHLPEENERRLELAALFGGRS
jgi:hypothetical protein